MESRFLISRILAGQIEYHPNKKIDRIDHGQSVHCTNYPRPYQKILNHLKELGITDPAEPFILLNINITDYYSPVPTLRSSISRFSV